MRYAVVIEKGERNDSACAGARDVESARRAWRSLPRMRRLRCVPNAPTSNAIPAAPRRDAAENGSVMAVPGLDPGIVQAIDWRQTVMAGLVVPCAGHPRCGARMSGGWVYIMTNRPNGVLYRGVTSDIGRRAYEHREALVPGFTKRYGLKRLVYAEFHDRIADAIQRESNIKHWPRAWKARLILEANPGWLDLYETLNQ